MTTDLPTQRRTRERHVARSARILSTGLSATAILGITAAFGAADRAQSSAADQTPTADPTIAGTPSALAPLGAPAIQTPSTSVSQFPSPEGTITLPTASPTPQVTGSGGKNVSAAGNSIGAPSGTVAAATAEASAATPASPLDTVAPTPISIAPVPTTAAPTPTTPATVAPIAPAEPPVELTLPPAPSNGSSGGSR